MTADDRAPSGAAADPAASAAGAEPQPALDLADLRARLEATLLGGARRYTRAEVAAAAGMPVEDALTVWRALGFATTNDEEVVFSDGDVAALSTAERLVEEGVVDRATRTAITRQLGQAFSRLAETQVDMVLQLLAARPDLWGSPDAVVAYVGELIPAIEGIQSFVWRRQLVASFDRAVAGLTGPDGAEAPDEVVGFADLAGFTTLTRHADEAQLRELLESFESLATELVAEHGGQIVKTIGDEVLFVVPEAAAAAQLGLALVQAAEADARLPALRVGLAAGPVISRLGDVFGATVNLASRLTSLARPGWVLVDRALAEALRADTRFELQARRPESVRGYHHLRQWRLLPARPGASGSPGGPRELRAGQPRRRRRRPRR